MADNFGILSILECPVCFEYIIPPIYQCHNQHLLCLNCQKKQTHCPVCRVKLQNDRNLCMEKVTEYISYPCKYEGDGCNATLSVYEKENHERACLAKGQHHCCLLTRGGNVSQCDWIGPYGEVDSHIRQKHHHLIKNSLDGSFSFCSSELRNYQYYILFDDNLFCVLIHTDPLRTSSVQKVFTFFFHIVSITCRQENCYAYSVKIEGQDDTFEGFVGKMITHADLKDVAGRRECLHFMGKNHIFLFQGNIVKL